MTPQQRFRNIVNWTPPFIIPSDQPIMNLEDVQRASACEWAKVTCPVKREADEVQVFVDRQTRRGGWIVKNGYPVRRDDERYEWLLLRY